MAKNRQMTGISQVLGGLLDKAGLGHLVYEEKLRAEWGRLLGPKACGIAKLEGLKGWTLKVRVESATWRQELHYQRDALKRRANDILGAELVKDVMLV